MKQALIILVLTLHFIAVSSAQHLPQKKPDTRGRISAQATVSQELMPNLSTGEFTCDLAKKKLIEQFRQERVICLSPEASNLPAGIIFDQDPQAGARLLPSTRITLHISNGPPTVPPTGDNTNNDNAAVVQPSADVSVTQQLDGNGQFHTGESVQYTIVIHNDGPAEATNVRIVETPTNLKDAVVTGDCQAFPCNIPKLAKDADATIKLTASIDRDGPFQSEVRVSATEDVTPGNNSRVTGGLAALIPTTPSPTPSPTPSATPTPSPSLTPPPPLCPDPWVCLLILAVGGGGLVVSGGTAVHLIRKRRRRLLKGSQSPAQPLPQPPQQPTPPQPPPIPTVDPNVELRPGESKIDSLQMTGPQISLQTDLRAGGTTFDGPVPIVRKEARNE